MLADGEVVVEEHLAVRPQDVEAFHCLGVPQAEVGLGRILRQVVAAAPDLPHLRRRADGDLHPRADLLGVGIEGDFLTLTYPRNKNADAQWIVEAAGDVGNWLAGPTQVMLSDDGTIEIWKATDTVPITAAEKRYMRVKVIVP